MCYTCGTTGQPEGRRVLAPLDVPARDDGQPGRLPSGSTAHDVVLPVVPMFHANAWGMPYAAAMAGAKLVFAGQFSADPASLADLIEGERVTVAAGVPTVWTGLLQYLEAHPRDLSSLRAVTAAAPRSRCR